MPRYLIVLSLGLFISGCAVNKPFGAENVSFEDIPLPLPVDIRCCWQSQERLIVQKDEQSVELLSVIVVQPEGLSIFMLDTFGRQLLKLTQNGHDINKEVAAELDGELPINRLLAGIYLSYADPKVWPLKDTVWDIVQDDNAKVLRHRQLEVVRVISSGDLTAGQDNQERLVKIIYSKPSFNVQVKRLTWNAL